MVLLGTATTRPAVLGMEGHAGPDAPGAADDLYLKLNKQRRALELLSIQVRPNLHHLQNRQPRPGPRTRTPPSPLRARPRLRRRSTLRTR